MSKIAGYVQRIGNDVEQHCLQARYKHYITLATEPDFWKRQRDAYQPSIFVRHYFRDQPLPVSPAAVADPVTVDADRLRSAGVPVAGVMGYNEVGHTGDGLSRLAELEMALIDIFASRGLRYLAGNFPVTWPQAKELKLYSAVLNRLVEKNGWLDLHNYGAPTMSGRTDLTLHHRTLKQVADANGWRWPQVIIGECGIDGGVLDGQLRGFRAFPQTDYVAELRWFLAELEKDGYVEAACVFGTGMNGDWETFDVVGSAVASQVAALSAYTAPPQPQPETIRVKLTTGEVVVLPIEEYLRGVLPSEWYATWGMEALKAGAVAARTFSKWMKSHPKYPDADVGTTASTQVYNPANITAKTDQAIRETAGEVWKGVSGQYVNRCGRPDCPLCKGQNGLDGKHWTGRMCQWGTQHMAAAGSGYRQIVTTYYGPNQGEEVTMPGTVPDLKGYDGAGNEVDANTLLTKYQAHVERAVVAAGKGVLRLVAVREKYGDTACIARVTYISGNYANAAVAWHWPDAPQQNPAPFASDWERNYEVGMLVPVAGQRYAEVGFPMGGGGVIHAGGGPHKMWPLSPSTPADLAAGIGWDGATNHNHLDWEWVETVEPDTAITGDVESVLRNFLWNHMYQPDKDGNFPYLPDGAFPRKARELGLLAPVTVEHRLTINGTLYASQGFTGGFLYTVDGDWEHLRKGTW